MKDFANWPPVRVSNTIILDVFRCSFPKLLPAIWFTYLWCSAGDISWWCSTTLISLTRERKKSKEGNLRRTGNEESDASFIYFVIFRFLRVSCFSFVIKIDRDNNCVYDDEQFFERLLKHPMCYLDHPYG